jgi:hypothetical protein
VSGFVYFIGPECMWSRDEQRSLVKIGYTKNDPFQRLHALEAGSPIFLEMYCFIEGSQALEQAFHEAFAELRSHREWFYNERKLRDFLSYLYDPPAKREPVERGRLCDAVHDNIFASSSSHPSMTDEAYLASANPRHLVRWFPEAVPELAAV